MKNRVLPSHLNFPLTGEDSFSSEKESSVLLLFMFSENVIFTEDTASGRILTEEGENDSILSAFILINSSTASQPEKSEDIKRINIKKDFSIYFVLISCFISSERKLPALFMIPFSPPFTVII